jgi:predicted SAM-dependent methyltransferase
MQSFTYLSFERSLQRFSQFLAEGTIEFAKATRTNFYKVSRVLRRPPAPQMMDTEVNLHLGCGSINHPKFINIDGRPAPHIHYIRPIDDLSPFDKQTVNLIYACHCLEHFSYRDIPQVLMEWHRVLKPGGILRLSVPDIDCFFHIYQAENRDLEDIIGLVMGGQDYAFNFHKAIFNAASLEKFLREAGFKEVRPWQPGQCEMTTFDDWSGRLALCRYPISLNLEAIK